MQERTSLKMISQISFGIVDLLVNNKIIEVKQVQIYQYGFEILISSIFTCLIALLCGVILKCLFAAILYFFVFAILRSICGGYHAEKYWQCNLIFTMATLFVLSFYKYLSLEEFNEFHYIGDLLSVLVTFYYAPVENPNKPLSDKQKQFFRFFSTAMVVLLALISSVLMIKYEDKCCILIDMTLFIVSISMFVTDPKRGGEKT